LAVDPPYPGESITTRLQGHGTYRIVVPTSERTDLAAGVPVTGKILPSTSSFSPIPRRLGAHSVSAAEDGVCRHHSLGSLFQIKMPTITNRHGVGLRYSFLLAPSVIHLHCTIPTLLCLILRERGDQRAGAHFERHVSRIYTLTPPLDGRLRKTRYSYPQSNNVSCLGIYNAGCRH